MNKFKDIILIVIIAFTSSLIAKLFIKLLINNDVKIFDLSNYLTCITLPIILLFFEKNFTKKRLIITCIIFPIIWTLISYWNHII